MVCKRVLFSDDWYPTLVRRGVDLVTHPVERIADGRSRPAVPPCRRTWSSDARFQMLDFLGLMSVTGLGGRWRRETWREGARRTSASWSGHLRWFSTSTPST